MTALLYRLFEWVPLILVLALGAALGSFLNVVVYRLPAGLSLLWPPSRCPHCEHRLGPTENLPVVGWLRLGGRCLSCKAPISPRYPLVELAMALLLGLVYGVYGLSWQTLGYGLLFCWLLALALIDWDTLTLPNPLTQSGLILGLLFQGLWGGLGGDWAGGLMAGLVGAVLGLWLLSLISWLGSAALGQTAMGGGDAKLAAMMGAWLGWKLLLLSGFLACLLGAIAGVSAMAMGWLGRRQAMPFGPFLALGAGISVLWGNGLVALYLTRFFPVGG